EAHDEGAPRGIDTSSTSRTRPHHHRRPAPRTRERARPHRLLPTHQGAAAGSAPPLMTAADPLLRGDLATPPRTLLDILRETATTHPDASALDDGEGALSYRELLARVIASAASLHAAGVRRGDRVGIRMPSGSRDLYIGILGVIAAGAAYVPVDADDPEERAQ